MSFLKYDSTVKVQNGYYCFHTITEFRGVDWKYIEDNNILDVYKLNSPIQVETSSGIVDVDIVQYLGKHSLLKITFENNSQLHIHKNQVLEYIDKSELGFTPIWDTVENISKLIATKPISITTLNSDLQIRTIESSEEQVPLYSLGLPGSTVFYIQDDIKIR